MASTRQASTLFPMYTALVVGVGALITSVVDYKQSRDLATDPAARPLAWTSEDERNYQRNHQELHNATDKTIERLLERIRELENWKQDHERFARDRSIIQSEQDSKQDANIQELYRLYNNNTPGYYQRIPRTYNQP